MNAITAVGVSAESNSLLNCVAQAMQDPATDVHKLELLIRLQREIAAETARLDFAHAMRAAQSEMQPIVRSAQNASTNSKYAPLEVIDAAIRPIYTRHGFVLEFDSEPVEVGVRMICEVTHAGGHRKVRRLEAALDTAGPQGKPNKTPVQALVSSTTYLRRTLTCMVFNLALTNEDNDGNRLRPLSNRISLEQLAVLSDLLRQTGTDEARFLAVMAPDLASIEDVTPANFPRLKNALLTKQSVLAQRRKLAIEQAQLAEAAKQARAPIGEPA